MMGMVVPEICWAYKKHNKIMTSSWFLFFSFPRYLCATQVQYLILITWITNSLRRVSKKASKLRNVTNALLIQILSRLLHHDKPDQRVHCHFLSTFRSEDSYVSRSRSRKIVSWLLVLCSRKQHCLQRDVSSYQHTNGTQMLCCVRNCMPRVVPADWTWQAMYS